MLLKLYAKRSEERQILPGLTKNTQIKQDFLITSFPKYVLE